MKRKTFLYALGAATASRLITKCETPHLKNTHRYDGKRLIILRLDGGNDGLYALAPKHNESLKKLRPTLLKNTIVDGINLEHIPYMHSYQDIYEPWYLEQDREEFPNPRKEDMQISWNGRWTLEFTSPFYIWLLENL